MATSTTPPAEGPGRSDTLSQRVGFRQPFANESFSKESVERAAAFVPEPSDIFIATVPKSGTTLLQMLCHALRTDGLHTDFEDIYQVQPWDQMAWDLGLSLEAEQPARPRLFKSHLRLAELNRGAKYLCIVREPEAVVQSWWRFLREKDVPPVRPYQNISEFVYDKDFVAEGMRFGASIWEYYTEYFKCLDLPEVLVVCYEDLVSDLRGHLPRVAQFMGLPAPTEEVTERVLRLCSRESMAEMGSKFDESWAYEVLRRLGRAPNGAESFAPAPRVHLDPPKEVLDDAAKAFLQQRWRDVVEAETGLPDYAALVAAVRRNSRPC